MPANDTFLQTLKDVKELQVFAHDFIMQLSKRKTRPAHGEDLSKHAKELGVAIPKSLQGAEMTWDSRHEPAEMDGENGSVLVLASPGNPEALGLTLGCITIHGVKVCLECGWLYCRIVIKGRF
jgi:hypothetical protein